MSPVKHHNLSLSRAVIIFLMVVGGLFFVLPAQGASVIDGALRYKLDNGLTVILREDHSAPVAALQIWVKTGSANETQEEAGITHFIEHLIFKGTPTRKTGEIARTIEASGGQINAYTTYDRTVYFVEISSEHFSTALEVLLDAVLHASFDPEEIEREREVVLEEYRRSLDLPRSRLHREMMRLCYQEHPYGRPIIGYESTIRAFDRLAVTRYVEKWYHPENMVLAAVGDFDAGLALNRIRKLAVEFPGKVRPTVRRPKEPQQKTLRRLALKDRVQQVYLDASWPIPDLTHQDIPALDLLEIILGHGRSSRLYNRLKMQSNLVHTIHASAYALADPGLFSVSGTLSSKTLVPALRAIAGEIGQLASDLVPREEVEKAKIIAEAQFLYEMESLSGQASTLGFFEMMRGDMVHARTYVDALMKVTPEDVRRVARDYLKPERLSVGALYPEDAVEAPSRLEVLDLFSAPFAQTTRPLEARTAGTRGDKLTARKTSLPSGVRVITRNNPRLPVVSMAAVLLGGTRLERAEHSGISGFAAKMLTRGTGNRSAEEIASAVEGLGGSVEGFSGRNSLGVRAKFLARDIQFGLELMADLLLRPAFPPNEVEKAREDLLAAIRAKKDRPASQAFDLFYETLYREHPYRLPQSGTETAIASIKAEDLRAWHEDLVAPQNLVLAIVGDVDEKAVTKQVEALFGGLSGKARGLREVPPEPPFRLPREARLETKGAQTHLVLGFLDASMKSLNDPPMALVETALSGQGGRLFFHLRDRQSLAYAVSAFRHPGLETGAFAVYLACDPAKVSEARRAIMEQLGDLVEKGLTEEELKDAKQYLRGTTQVGLQTNSSQAIRMALDELYGLGYDHYSKFVKDINAVTLKDVQRAIRETIRPEAAVFVTVGP